MIPLSLLAFTFLPSALTAPPLAPDVGSIHIPIVRRSTTVQDRVANLPHVVDAIRAKYGFKSRSQKRDVTSAAITDEQNDSSYSAVVSIGKPAQSFNLILDTSSSDLWVATTQCHVCGTDIPLFDPSKSSSYENSSSSVNMDYTLGNITGYISQDSVTFAGFSMTQIFLSVTETSSSFLKDGLSGMMGLGPASTSAIQVTPFWQALYNQNKLSSPVFSLYLQRYVDQSQVIDAAPGGIFTLGGTNSSLYSGSIQFINLPNSTTTYWVQQVKSITVQGKAIAVSGNESLASIDTSTSLIGGPSDLVAQIWSNVPGSKPFSGQYDGFKLYSFPCNTSVTVSISFGGTSWDINPADMNVGTVSGSGSEAICAGSIFDVGGSTVLNDTSLPSWIIGDTFLKNVYSVFQADPPAIGFAQLANGLSGSSTSGTNPIGSDTGVPLPSSASSSSSLFAAGKGSATWSAMSLTLVIAVLAGWFITL